jgi:protein SCO1/2
LYSVGPFAINAARKSIWGILMTKLSAILSALALVALVGGTALYTFLTKATDCGISPVAGAAIGGPFELVNAEGQAVTDADVIDTPSLVYFGYTFCPDVCPFDMARNALAVDLLEDQGTEVGLVFVTIDPARDTPEILSSYVSDMHPRMFPGNELGAFFKRDDTAETIAEKTACLIKSR